MTASVRNSNGTSTGTSPHRDLNGTRTGRRRKQGVSDRDEPQRDEPVSHGVDTRRSEGRPRTQNVGPRPTSQPERALGGQAFGEGWRKTEMGRRPLSYARAPVPYTLAHVSDVAACVWRSAVALAPRIETLPRRERPSRFATGKAGDVEKRGDIEADGCPTVDPSAAAAKRPRVRRSLGGGNNPSASVKLAAR